jgi:hypothetical protein
VVHGDLKRDNLLLGDVSWNDYHAATHSLHEVLRLSKEIRDGIGTLLVQPLGSTLEWVDEFCHDDLQSAYEFFSKMAAHSVVPYDCGPGRFLRHIEQWQITTALVGLVRRYKTQILLLLRRLIPR